MVSRVSLVLLFAIGVVITLPAIYGRYVNHRFSSEMDSTFGPSGWAIIRMGADHQNSEQLNLYRTLYVRFIYPKWLNLTPWEKLRFTHETSCLFRPWHYWLNVVTQDREITYYWSIRENKWVNIWDNPIARHPPSARKEYMEQRDNYERRHGLNIAKEK